AARRRRDRALPADAGAGLPRLQRPGHFAMAGRDPADHHYLDGGLAAAEHRLHAGGRVADPAGDPDVHRLQLLGLPGQGAAWRGLPLMWAKRLGWLALIWAASVAALGVVALLIRLGMNAAGMISVQ